MDAIKLQSILPKFPMKDLPVTRSFYRDALGLRVLGEYGEYDGNYLMVGLDAVQIHLFLFPGLQPKPTAAYVTSGTTATLVTFISSTGRPA